MIGSTLSRMGAAEKLSIPQLQRAIQDGTVPAYIGVPLLQDKMKQQQEAKAMAAGQVGKQPTIADQVMLQATQEEQQAAIARQQAEMQRAPSGVDQLPIAEPVSAMAHGGIIAFATGGDTEDQDYDEYLQDVEDAEDDAQQTRFMNLMGLSGAADMGYGDVTGSKLKADRSKPVEKIGHKYEDTVLKYADKYGVDPKLALHVLNKETGGLKNPEAAQSKAGAMGIMQLMPATAKMLGVKDRANPEESAEGGVRYLAMLSRQFGNDPRLTAAAYNAGPGNVRKYGGVPPFAETRGYVQGLAQGGIASFEDGGETTIDPVTGEAYTPEYEGQGSGLLSRLKKATGYGRMLPESERGWPTTTENVTFPGAAQAEVRRADNKIAKTTPTAIQKQVVPVAPVVEDVVNKTTTPTGTPEEKPKNFYEQLKEELSQERKDRAAAKEQDKWMGLLTAGLGMMGGTSQYAATNVGQGALAGVSQYSAARKQAAAEDAAAMKNILLAQKYQEQGELASAQQQANEAYRKQQLGLTASSQASSDLSRKQSAFDQYKKENEAAIEKQYGSLMVPDARTALNRFYSTPEFLALRNAAFPDLPKATSSSSAPVLRYDSQGNPIR